MIIDCHAQLLVAKSLPMRHYNGVDHVHHSHLQRGVSHFFFSNFLLGPFLVCNLGFGGLKVYGIWGFEGLDVLDGFHKL